MASLGLLTIKCRGHPNVQLTHPSTLEFALEDRLTPRGDCIACVSAKMRLEGSCRGYARGYILVSSPDTVSRVVRFTGIAGDCKKPIIRRSSTCTNSIVCRASISALDIHHLARLLQSPYAILKLVVGFYEPG